MGYVYMIGPAEPVTPYRVKIGKADDVSKRLVGMQTGSLVTLKVMWMVEHPEPYKLERRLHESLADFRTHGEWFVLGHDPIAILHGALAGRPPRSKRLESRSEPVTDRNILNDI